MSTTLTAQTQERQVSYTPFGEDREIVLSIGTVRTILAVRTKKGHEPTNTDAIKFLMLCQAQALNPWSGDAYCIGYDSNDGPTFSLVVSIGALYKRAEANENFDGIESGVIVKTKDSPELVYRAGDLVLAGETLIGAWARCHRKDLTHPFYDALDVKTFDKKQGRWNIDKAGMIVKCAEASVLRKAFATQLGGLYIEHEMSGQVIEANVKDVTDDASDAKPKQKITDVNAALEVDDDDNAVSMSGAWFERVAAAKDLDVLSQELAHDADDLSDAEYELVQGWIETRRERPLTDDDR